MINLSKIVKNWQDKSKVYQHVKQRENSKKWGEKFTLTFLLLNKNFLVHLWYKNLFFLFF